MRMSIRIDLATVDLAAPPMRSTAASMASAPPPPGLNPSSYVCSARHRPTPKLSLERVADGGRRHYGAIRFFRF